jgi:hypothetical protein
MQTFKNQLQAEKTYLEFLRLKAQRDLTPEALERVKLQREVVEACERTCNNVKDCLVTY